MVEDNEIKTTISPFRMREGEIKVFDGKDGYVSMNQILQKINLGHINDIHFKILDLINKFEFLTSRQMFQLLEHENADIKSQDKLNNKLDQLIRSKILTRYYFTSPEGSGIYRVYCMEKMGKYLLTSREIECKWQPSDNAKPVEMIKKKLAGNQLVIAYMRKVKAFSDYKLKPQILAKTLNKQFKPVASIDLEFSGRKISFVYEVIRRNVDWENKLIERMNLWKDFYENFTPGDSGFTSIPGLILVCEDDRHMAEIFKTIVTNKISIPKITLYYTTDFNQNNDSLSKSLYDFIEENGKYKIRNVEAKILA